MEHQSKMAQAAISSRQLCSQQGGFLARSRLLLEHAISIAMAGCPHPGPSPWGSGFCIRIPWSPGETGLGEIAGALPSLVEVYSASSGRGSAGNGFPRLEGSLASPGGD